MTVVATVLVHRAGPILGDVIRGIVGQNLPPRALIVLDNGGPRSVTQTQLESWMEGSAIAATLLRSDVNLGVGGGHNMLLAAASAMYKPDWFWMLEHDTVVDADCLHDLFLALSDGVEVSPTAGAVVPNLARSNDQRAVLWPDDVALRPQATSMGRRFTFNAVLLSRVGGDGLTTVVGFEGRGPAAEKLASAGDLGRDSSEGSNAATRCGHFVGSQTPARCRGHRRR